MKYLKLFDTETNYLAYRDGSDYLKPNVSLCDGNSTVYYNYPPPKKFNRHDYVDLELPSGTLWATMNVGASKPSDAGLYFQWGDTIGYTAAQVGTGSGQKKFAKDWSDYKWGKSPNFSKYSTKGAALELEDDAAHVNMGGDWHIPSPDQIQELLGNTTSAWTDSNGTGVTFTSSNGKSIFFPAAGGALDGSLVDSGGRGYVWSSMLDTNDVTDGQYLNFLPRFTSLNSSYRFYGRPMRGVVG